MGFEDLLPALFDGYFVKIIFLIHVLFTYLSAIFNSNTGSTIEYLSYNSLFVIAILLTIVADKSADVALVTAALDVVCIAIDLVWFIGGSTAGTMATVFAIFNLVFRPVSAILLLRNYSARAGVADPTGGLLEVNVATTRSQSYHNIEEPSQTLP